MNTVAECEKKDKNTQFWLKGSAGITICTEPSTVSPLSSSTSNHFGGFVLRSEEICNPDAVNTWVECKYDYDFPPQTGCAPCLDPFCSMNVTGRRQNSCSCAQITDDTLRLVDSECKFANYSKKSDTKPVEMTTMNKSVCCMCDKNNGCSDVKQNEVEVVECQEEPKKEQQQLQITWCDKYLNKKECEDEGWTPSMKKVVEEMQAKIAYLESCLRQLSNERQTKNKKVQVPPPADSATNQKATDAATA